MALSPAEMEKAISANMKDKTGKSIEEWIEIVKTSFYKDSPLKEQVNFLKSLGLGHFQAQVVLKTIKSDDHIDYEDENELIKGLFLDYDSEMRKLYDSVSEKLKEFGCDVVLKACKTYMPFYRNTIFAVLKPSANGLRVGLQLSDNHTEDFLKPTKNMSSEKINYEFLLTSIEDLDEQKLALIQESYNNN